ncbi:MAG: type IV secretion system protein [Candidatus Moraniibacteriota bacterium]
MNTKENNIKSTERKKATFIRYVIIFSLFLILIPVFWGNNNYSFENNNIYPPQTAVAQAALPVAALAGITVIDPMTGAIMSIAKDQLSEYIKNGWVTPQQSTGWLEWIARGVLRALLLVVFIVTWLFYCISYSLVSASEWILGIFFKPDFIKDLGGFTTESFVKNVAYQVANLCNMLYLVFLLYIAIMSMFGKTDTYRLLVKLIIAALLTNFSLVLSGVIIDASQVMMHSVFKENQEFKPGTNIIGNMEKVILYKDIQESDPGSLISSVSSSETITHIDDSPTFWEMTVGFFFNEKNEIKKLISRDLHALELVVFAFAMVVTLVTITVILAIRIVALWILLILSPIAITFSAFPPTEKYWQQWLESLTKYAFTGPILVFFLWLGNKASETLRTENKLQALTDKYANGVREGESFADDLYVFVVQNFPITFRFFVLLIIIWAGILIANEFGIKGAKGVDGLIKDTKGLSGGVLKFIRGSGKLAASTVRGIGRGSFLGSRFANYARKGQLQELQKQQKIAQQAGDTGKEKLLAQQIKEQSKLIDASDKARIQRLKFFSAISPRTLKKELAGFWQRSSKDYTEDSEAALREFSNKFFLEKLSGKKRKDIRDAGDFTAITLRDTDKELKEKYDKIKQNDTEKAGIRNLDDPRRAELDKQNDQLFHEAENLASSIADSCTENELNKETIKTSILNKFNQPNSPASFLDEQMISGAQKLARNNQEEVWRTSILQKEKKEKEIKEKDELIDKMKLTPEQMVRMFERGEGNKDMQIALLRKIAASGKYFGDLLQKMTKNFNTENLLLEIRSKNPGVTDNDTLKKLAFTEARRRATDAMKERATETELLGGMRAADGEGRKSKNLSQIGLVNFDQVSGKWKVSSESDRMNILGKYVKDLRPIDINQLHMQTFDDGAASEAFVKNINWADLAGNERFVRELKESIFSRLKKDKNEILKAIDSQDQKDGFERLLKFKDRLAITPQGQTGGQPEVGTIIPPYNSSSRGVPRSTTKF